MHKRGMDRATTIIILVGAIVVFGIISAGIIYNALETGTILGFNITSHSNDTVVEPPIDDDGNVTLREGPCYFIDSYWSDGSSALSWVREGQSVQLVVEAEGCEGNLTTFSLFKSINGTIVPLLESLPALISNGEARFSWITEANISLTTSYYFIATLTGTTMTERSPSIGIEAPLEPILFDPLLCRGFNDDRDYLYNVSFLSVSRTTGPSFTIKLNETLLRTNTSADVYYIDRSNGALSINYELVPTCGGVDVKYTISNPTSQPQQMPDFQIDGFLHPKVNAQYLYTKGTWGNLMETPSGNSVLYQYPYPYEDIYSPVMVAVNNELAIGTSFQHAYLQDHFAVQPFLFWNTDGSQAYRYNLNYNIQNIWVQTAYLNPGQTRTYTITLRFAPRNNWLMTLYPYKQHFNLLYDSVRSTPPKDLRPVGGYGMSDSLWQDDVTNPRGYIPDSIHPPGIDRNRPDIYGWKNSTDWVIKVLKPYGYMRSMMWLPSGAFKDSICAYCNFPPQFMDWLPKLVETQSELLRIKQAGISLGYWWGHAGSVPIPHTWPPTSLAIANYSNPAHRAFLEEQFELARQRGADEIGLDAYTVMEPYDRYTWAKEMQRRDPTINLIHEIGGPDFMHTVIGNFYTDTYNDQSQRWNYVNGPHLLAWYLNPHSETWILTVLNPGQIGPYGGASAITTRALQLKQWGYTYVDSGTTVNVTDWDLDISDCLDGIDNDRDGKTDWPRDSGCASELDLTED